MPRTPSVLAPPAAAAAMPRAGQGETDRVLAALHADHADALLRYAMHLTGGDMHPAEDVVQKTMLRACQRPGRVVGQPARAWLFTVARHWTIDQHRARQARPAEVAGLAELTAGLRRTRSTPRSPGGTSPPPWLGCVLATGVC